MSDSSTQIKLASEKPSSEIYRRRIAKFQRQLENPDHVRISTTRARSEYGLTRKHLSELVPLKDNTSLGREESYWLPDVVAKAKQDSSDEMIVERYRHYLESGRHRSYRRSQIYGMNEMEKVERPTSWFSHLYFSRKDNEIQGEDVVIIAIKQNIAITLTKAGVWLLTGSGAVFADAMHSVADILNGWFRYIGINLANRDPDYRHPYGYERLRYVFTDRSTGILLFVGGVIPFWSGILRLSHSPELKSPGIIAFLFLVVGILETPALIRSYHTLLNNARRANLSLWAYMRYGNDMITITTFTECGLGVIAAAAGVLSTAGYMVTGDPIYDTAASLFMASTVAIGCLGLMAKNAKALVGETLPVAEVEQLMLKLEDEETVNSIHDVKTEVLGVDTVRFKAEVEFNAEAITRKIKNLTQIPSPESALLLDQVSKIRTEVEVEDWLMKNNALYQASLANELKRIEEIIKGHLQELNFKKCYIDLELW